MLIVNDKKEAVVIKTKANTKLDIQVGREQGANRVSGVLISLAKIP